MYNIINGSDVVSTHTSLAEAINELNKIGMEHANMSGHYEYSYCLRVSATSQELSIIHLKAGLVVDNFEIDVVY